MQRYKQSGKMWQDRRWQLLSGQENELSEEESGGKGHIEVSQEQNEATAWKHFSPEWTKQAKSSG